MKSKYSKDKKLELMADVLCKVITTVLDLGSELKKKVKKILFYLFIKSCYFLIIFLFFCIFLYCFVYS